MDIDGDEDYKDGILGDAHGGLDMCTSTSTSATRGKGKGRTSTARMSSQAQNQSQMGLSQATMTPSASRTRSSQAQTHHRGPSRTHIPPIPVQNNDSAAGRAVVPLPAATGTTFNTTINPNGTVTLTRSTSERQREQGYSQGRPFKQPSSPTSSSSTNSAHMTMTSHAHANMAKGPLTPTSDKSFDHEGGGSGTGPGLDLKTLMSPPTPAPSPTPGRNGWWGTVARDGHEGGVSGGNAGQREDGSFGEFDCESELSDGVFFICFRARLAKLMVLHPVVRPHARPIAAIVGIPVTPATDPTSNIGGPLTVVDEERAVDAQRQYRAEVEEGFLERVACRIGIARSELCE
jgi:hypothetical protein